MAKFSLMHGQLFKLEKSSWIEYELWVVTNPPEETVEKILRARPVLDLDAGILGRESLFYLPLIQDRIEHVSGTAETRGPASAR